MSRTLHRLRWIAPIAVLVLAAVLRLWALGRPDSLVFDELYYVRDAISQLGHGFTTTWPDDDAKFTDPWAYSDHPNAIAHPPLGKWLIALGVLMFGPDNGWGWRISAALAGIAAVGLVMRLGWLMTRSLWVACLAGLLLAVDGVHVVLSRVGVLDGFLATLILLGALFVWHDQMRVRVARSRGSLGRIVWARPWLVTAGLAFGAAAAVKWSGLYPLAAFLVLVTIRDWWLRRRLRVRLPFVGAALQAMVAGVIALGSAFVAYLSSWLGWILNPGGQERVEGEPWWVSLVRWHGDAWSWHTTLSAPHPYATHPLGWPLALRPTSMYQVRWTEGCPLSGGCVSTINPLPNPLVTWAGVLALALLIWVVLRAVRIAVRPGARFVSGRRSPFAPPAVWISLFVLAGYLSGWLPWLLTLSRSAVYQFYAVVLTPFAALALALVLASLISPAASLVPRRAEKTQNAPMGAVQGHFASSRGGGFAAGNGERARGGGDRGAADWNVVALAGIRLDPSPDAALGRRLAVLVYLTLTLILAVLFFPTWSGIPMAEWFWRAHIWLPGWK